jgi:hypothetical protein
MTPGQTPLPFRTIEQAETSEQSAVELELVDLYERLQFDHARTRADLAESERLRAELAARVRELETLVALYARNGVQA